MDPKLLFLIPLLPLCGALLNALFGLRLSRALHGAIAVGAVAASFAVVCLLWPLAAGEGTRTVLATWLASGNLRADFGLLFDPLSAAMALMVTGVSTLIHLYAVGYMHLERDTARFFALLNLFVFAMLCIVLADNLLLLFLGWEGVGFCSYGLIGFWYAQVENAAAGRKAFLVTRVGDVFFAIALLWLFAALGQLGIPEINALAPQLSPTAATAIVLLLLAGACGKSAQLPLMTWLPDAMAGPTPVSALIHAATMVTAGVYLLCRLFPVVSLSPTGMAAIALVGALTAFYAATCALAQREIKRVLAYSTMSQIGFMMLAVGVGTVSAAMFHLFTHAFFKALLFMAAGCVIHLTGGENDITRMGGVRKQSPFVFWMFLGGALCLAGAPLSGGFFSKDEILLADFARGSDFYRAVWLIGTVTAFLTALYTSRLVHLVFFGQTRRPTHGHRLPGLMRWTLPPLAILALAGGLLNLPPIYGGKERLYHFLGPLAGQKFHASHEVEYALAALATGLFALGWGLAWWRTRGYRPHEYGLVPNFLLHGWKADALVNTLILSPFRAIGRFCWEGLDRTLIEGVLHTLAGGAMREGETLRKLTSGRISTYLAGFAWGLLALLLWFLLVLAQSAGPPHP